MEFHKMTGNNETQLNEAELSAVKNSIATLAKKYIAGSFFDKLVATTGISQAKDILLGDLKNMVGRGTSAPAAAKFAQAIKFAKSTTAVDTILANYMLAGDGMKSGIGYRESQDAPDGYQVSEASISSEITGFRQFLSESRKNDLKEKQKEEKSCGGKKRYKTKEGKEIPKEKIDEAIAIVKEAGCTVDDSKIMPTEEEIAEAIKIAEANGFHVVNEKKSREDDKKKVEEALALIKSAGLTVNESSGDDWVTVPTLGVDPEDLRDAIDDGIALKYIKCSDSITNVYVLDNGILIKFDKDEIGAKELLSEIRDGLKQLFMEDAGSVVAYGEETVDELDHIFDAAIKQA